MSSGCRDKHNTALPNTPPPPFSTLSDKQGELEGGRGLEQHLLWPSSGWALILGPSSNSLPTCPATSSPAELRPPQSEPTAALNALALKINYSVEVRGEKTKADPSVSGAGGQCRSAAGKWCDSGIYHRGDHRINTRSGCRCPPQHPSPTPTTPPNPHPQPLSQQESGDNTSKPLDFKPCYALLLVVGVWVLTP